VLRLGVSVYLPFRFNNALNLLPLSAAQRTWPDLLLARSGREWTLNGHQRGLPVHLFDQYDAATKSGGGSMRWRAFIGIVSLAISHLAFANASSGLAQAGSVGGTIGKQDKSISGGEEADRRRAAPVPKRSAAKTRETPSGRACNRIVGTWSWYPSVNESVFHKDGTALHPASGTTGKWSCAGDIVNVVWSNGGAARTDRMTLSQDGNSISVVSPWGGGIKFTGMRRGPD
jgi:hypothetical protein